MDAVTLGLAQASAKRNFVSQRFKDAVRMRRVPGVIDARMNNPYNTQQQPQLVTTATRQYLVWPDGGSFINVGVRSYPDGEFAATSFQGRTDVGYLSLPVFYDEHNGLCMARDGGGIVHVFGNMHGSFMAYARTTAADTIAGAAGTWTAPGVIGSGNNAQSPMRADETVVSYPILVPLPNGDLVFIYRNGVSGDGDGYINYWSVANQAWTRIGATGTPATTANFIVGSTASTPESAYPTKTSYRLLPNGNFRIGFAWTWRPIAGGTPATNDLCYIQVDLTPSDLASPTAAQAKLATGWKAIDGTAVALPVTHPAPGSPVIAVSESTYNGLDAGQAMDLDVDGNPHISQPMLIGGVSGRFQIRHIYWDGTTWVQQQATNWTNVSNTQNVRPAIFCTNDRRTYMLVSWVNQGWRDGVRLIDCTPGHNLQTIKLADIPLRVCTPSVDIDALRNQNSLEMFFGPSSDYPTPIAGIGYGNGTSVNEMWSLEQWQQQFGMVMSIDLAQLEQIQSSRSRRLRIRPVSSGGVIGGSTLTNLPAWVGGTGPAPVNAPAGTQLTNLVTCITPPELRGKLVVARFSASASVDTNGKIGWLELGEAEPGAAARVLARLPFTLASSSIKSTPWVPLQLGPGGANNLDARVAVYGSVQSLTHVITISGAPTGGTWVPTWLGISAAGNTGLTSLGVNATAAEVKTCLAELLQRHLIAGRKISSGSGMPNCTDMLSVTGSAGGPWTVVVTPVTGVSTMYLTPPGLITAANSFTGGTSPAIAVTNVTGTLSVQGATIEIAVVEVA